MSIFIELDMFFRRTEQNHTKPWSG